MSGRRRVAHRTAGLFELHFGSIAAEEGQNIRLARREGLCARPIRLAGLFARRRSWLGRCARRVALSRRRRRRGGGLLAKEAEERRLSPARLLRAHPGPACERLARVCARSCFLQKRGRDLFASRWKRVATSDENFHHCISCRAIICIADARSSAPPSGVR